MSKKLDIDIKELFNPHWENHCGHKKEEYIGTIKYVQCPIDNLETHIEDIYIYGEQEVCIRFGPNPQDYRSPGNIVHFLQMAKTFTPYKKALEFMLFKGTFSYILNGTSNR